MRFEFGPYTLTIPQGARVHAEVHENGSSGSTIWTILIGRCQVHVWLSTTGKLGDLKEFILTSTKQSVQTDTLEVRGIPGEAFGNLATDQTRDRRFRKGEMMIYIRLHAPRDISKRERAAIDELIQSLRYEG